MQKASASPFLKNITVRKTEICARIWSRVGAFYSTYFQPREFLSSLRVTLDGQPNAVVYFEVPNGAAAFGPANVWHVMFEAGCFSDVSLARLFRESGFQVLDVLPALDGANLEIEARPASAPKADQWEEEAAIGEIAARVKTFAAVRQAAIESWTERFDQFAKRGQQVVLWAAGMRAISLLGNVPSAAETVEFVVDVNPVRQGRYLPKTAQEVISPERLAALKPDVVIATNPAYKREIHDQIRSLGLASEFVILE